MYQFTCYKLNKQMLDKQCDPRDGNPPYHNLISAHYYVVTMEMNHLYSSEI